VSISAKLQSLKAGKSLRLGGLVAHQTSTVSGIAASAISKQGIKKAQQFKQRQGPFLLLADCLSTALKQAIYIPTSLRKLAKTSWPGAVTLVFPARQHLHSACYQKRTIAVRVDADVETRRLAQVCGGLMLSSSLNRQGKTTKSPNLKLRYRWHRHLSKSMNSTPAINQNASKILKITGLKIKQLR